MWLSWRDLVVPGLWPSLPPAALAKPGLCRLRLSPGTCSRRGCLTSTPSSPPSGSGSRRGRKIGTSGRSSTLTASRRCEPRAPSAASSAGPRPAASFPRGWPRPPRFLQGLSLGPRSRGVWGSEAQGTRRECHPADRCSCFCHRVERLVLWWERRPPFRGRSAYPGGRPTARALSAA